MVKSKQRNRDKSVTPLLPILVPTKAEGDGEVAFLTDEDRGFVGAARTTYQRVKRFDSAEVKKRFLAEAPKRYLAMARLLAVTQGKDIDYSLIKQRFRVLVEDLFGVRLADLLTLPKKPAQLRVWSQRWLPPIFNREVRQVRLVMWYPAGDRTFRPGIYAPTVETAAFVSHLLSISGARACRCCGTLFVPRRRDQVYYDNAHAARHREARYRERQAAKQRRKGRVAVTATARRLSTRPKKEKSK